MGWVLSYTDKATLPKCDPDPKKVAQGKVLIACGGFVILAALFKGAGTRVGAAIGATAATCAWQKFVDAW